MPASKKTTAKVAPAKKSPAKKSPAKKTTAKKTTAEEVGKVEEVRSEPDSTTSSATSCRRRGPSNDWQFADSIAAGFDRRCRPRCLHQSTCGPPWWTINNQENTGSCVGWATADGVVR